MVSHFCHIKNQWLFDLLRGELNIHRDDDGLDDTDREQQQEEEEQQQQQKQCPRECMWTDQKRVKLKKNKKVTECSYDGDSARNYNSYRAIG